MKEFLKRIIKQYITCKHKDYKVIKEIPYGVKYDMPVFYEKRKCNNCGREFYSDYYIRVDKKKRKIYITDF
jgi:hypothetical protein